MHHYVQTTHHCPRRGPVTALLGNRRGYPTLAAAEQAAEEWRATMRRRHPRTSTRYVAVVVYR